MVSTYIRPGKSELGNLGLGTFAIDVSKFVKKAKGNIDLAIRKMIFEVFKRIVVRTPVDTGRCKAGWTVGKTWNMSSPLGGSPQYDTTPGGSSSKTHQKQGRRFRRVSSVSERGVGRYIGAQVKAGAGTFDKSGRVTASKGAQFLQGMEIKDGIICYIFNNVRYAIYLEGGRVYPSPPYGSPQAPKGMVRITLAEFGSITNEVVASVSVGGNSTPLIGI